MNEELPLQVFHATCQCGSHEIRASYDFADDREVNIAIWSYGNGSDKWSWKEKIRAIFWILRKGHPYGDQVALHPETVRCLSKALDKMADRAENAINVSQDKKEVVS